MSRIQRIAEVSRAREHRALRAAILAVLASAGTMEFAAAAEAPALEEIIVTAERRANSEQTTAISMDVLTGEALAESRTQTISDLQNATPSLVINTNGISQVVNIRGIGNSATTPTVTVGVGIYTDGLMAGETQNIGSAYFDVDTIEVLRGPQGTFVGQASTGGAIRINSQRPNFNGVNGYAEAVYGSYENTKFAGAINLPATDTLAARLAFNSEQKQSYFRNIGSILGLPGAVPMRSPGKTEDRNARVSLLWQPSEQFEAMVRAEFNSTDHDGPSTQPNPRIFNAPVAGQPGVTTPIRSQYWNYDDPAHDPWIINHNLLHVQDTSIANRFSVDLRYRFASGLELRSLSGYQHNDIRDIEDADASSATTTPTQVDIGPENNYYSQEFNLLSPDGPLNWVVGASWFYRNTPTINGGVRYPTCGINQGTGVFTPCAADPNFTSYGFNDNLSVARMGGLFGQVNWQLNNQWQVQAGARYSRDSNFARGGGSRAPTATPTAGTVTSPCSAAILALVPAGNYNCTYGPVTSGAYEGSEVTWKVGANWTPFGLGSDQFFYAFYARGYKPGGINGTGREYAEEQVDDYEIGWKGELFDNRVRVQLGGYWMEYDNMQQQGFSAPVGLPSAANQVTNIGDSTIRGVEFEVQALLQGFTIGFNTAYIDSELGDVSIIDSRALPPAGLIPTGQTFGAVQCAAGATTGCFDYAGVNGGPSYYVNLSGIQNVYSPELTYTFSLAYAWDIGQGTLRPSVNLSHTDKQYTTLFQDDFFSLDERNLLGASVAYDLDTWQFQAYCMNCSDKTYIAAVDTRAPFSVYYGAPRQLGLRIRKTF